MDAAARRAVEGVDELGARTALLIIDMQIGLVQNAYRAEAVVERIRGVLARARSARVPIVHLQHNHARYEPLIKGSPTWHIHPALHPLAGENVVEKTASDSFYGTDLAEHLRDAAVETLAIAGMQTEYCVDATCRRALSAGFDVILLRDCHTTAEAVLGAREIIRHHNHVLSTLAHPDRACTLMKGSELSFADD